MEIKEILLVDGKTPITSAIGFILQSRGYLITLAPDAETATAELDNYGFNLMLVYLSGHEKEMKFYLDLGFYISFAGPVTFKNANKLKGIVKKIPDDKIVLETDCQYLAPCPFRGKRNEPLYISHIYKEVSRLRGMNIKELENQILGNVKDLFDKI